MAEEIKYKLFSKKYKQQTINLIKKFAYLENPIQEFTTEYWDWLYESSPAGKAITYLALDKEKVIGHYSVIPVYLNLNGKKIKAALSVDTIVHPNYRRRGIFTTLAKRVYGELKKQKVSLVYGFPNKNSFPGFIKKLNWHYITNIPQLILPSRTCLRVINAIKLKNKKYQISQINRFDKSINDFWNKIKGNKITSWRDIKFLNWRIVGSKLGYKIFIIKRKNDKEICGYIVLRKVKLFSRQTGLIIDIVAPHKHIAKELIRHAINYFAKQKIALISVMMQKNAPYYKILKKFGFLKIPDFIHPRKWGLGILYNKKFINPYKWHICFSEWDCF